MTVVWCDPPPLHPRRWRPLLEEVMERPGEWAMLRPYAGEGQARDAVRYLRKPRSRKPEGVWSFRAARITEERHAWGVWARWDGAT